MSPCQQFRPLDGRLSLNYTEQEIRQSVVNITKRLGHIDCSHLRLPEINGIIVWRIINIWFVIQRSFSRRHTVRQVFLSVTFCHHLSLSENFQPPPSTFHLLQSLSATFGRFLPLYATFFTSCTFLPLNIYFCTFCHFLSILVFYLNCLFLPLSATICCLLSFHIRWVSLCQYPYQ
jgi:hypothetical protein